ncbi:MAG: glycosyltransferase family 2 protein [Chloroflexota bacterium]
MLLSVVMPARNEEGSLAATVHDLTTTLDADGIPFELIVVDDGSTDETADIAQSLGRADPRVRYVRNGPPHGFGRAVRAGLDAFTGDAVVVMMSDGSDSPRDVVRYYRVLRDDADCAFGSRFLSQSQLVNYPLVKLLLNRIANTGIAILFGLRYDDVTNAFKGYRRFVVDGCRPLVSPHFNFTVELPLKAITRGFSYRVLPISWTDRSEGTSHFRIKEMGSRYIHIVLSIFLEFLLTREDVSYPHSRIAQDRRAWRERAGI